MNSILAGMKWFAVAALFSATAFGYEIPVSQDTYASVLKSGTSIAASSGVAATLPVSKTDIAYVGFDFGSLPANGSGVPLGPLDLTAANLQLYVATATVQGDLSVYIVTSAWNESFKGKPVAAPTLGDQVATISAATLRKKSFVSVDVTSGLSAALVSGNFFGFAIVGSGETKVSFASKEGPAAGPAGRLILDYSTQALPNSNTVTGADSLVNIASATSLAGIGSNNTADGLGALYSEVSGSNNTAVGLNAMRDDVSGFDDTAVGFYALNAGNNDGENTAVGSYALASDNNGGNNTAIGSGALQNDTTGFYNTGVGNRALTSVTMAVSDTAVGNSALANLTTGNNNVGIGDSAGITLTTGSFNLDLAEYVPGSGDAVQSGDESYTTHIGGIQTRAFIAGVRGVTTGENNAVDVVIDSNGQLGTVSSSRKYKEDIHDMGDASARLLKLRPVTYRYKKPFTDGSKPLQYGLIAEDVAQSFPELVAVDKQGRPETVKYQMLAPILLNEFLKEHQQVATLESKMANRDKVIAEWQKKFAEQQKRQAALEAQIATMQQQMAAVAEKIGDGKIPVSSTVMDSSRSPQAQ